MGKRPREERPGGGPAVPEVRRVIETRRGGDWVRWANLAAIVGVAAVSVANWRLATRTADSIDDRLAQIDSRIEQLGKKVDAGAAAKQPRQGPDPNRVYTFRTDGAPARGPAAAPVTIVEVSDFQ